MPAVEDVTVLLRLRDELSRNLARVERQIESTTGRIDHLGRSGASSGAHVDGLGRSLLRLDQANSRIEGVTGSLLRIAVIGTAAATAGVLGLTAALGAVGVSSAAGFEQSRIAFGTLLEDVEGGKALFSELQEFNVQSPFELKSIASATQVLLQFGFTGENVVETMRTLANVAALSGDNAEVNLGRTAIALGQIRSAGVLRAQDLNQLVQAGFPAYALLQEVTGKTTAELRKQMESGLTLPAQEYIDAMNAGQGVMSKYATGAETMANTLTGQWSAVKDAAKLALADAFAPLALGLKETLRDLRGELPAMLAGVAPQANEFLGKVVGGLVRGLPGLLTVVNASLDGLNRLVEAAAPGLTGLEPLSGRIAEGIGRFVDELVPVMPDLVRGFAGLVGVLPEAIAFMGQLLSMTAPLFDFAGAVAETGAGNTAMAGLLVTLLGLGALTRVVGPVLQLSIALRALAVANAAAAATGAAGAAGAGAGAAGALARGSRMLGGGALVAGGGYAAYQGLKEDELTLGSAAKSIGGTAAIGAGVGTFLGPGGTLIGGGVGAGVGAIGVFGKEVFRRARGDGVGTVAAPPFSGAPPAAYLPSGTQITATTTITPGGVVVNNPTSDVDIQRALEEYQRTYEVERAERK